MSTTPDQAAGPRTAVSILSHYPSYWLTSEPLASSRLSLGHSIRHASAAHGASRLLGNLSDMVVHGIFVTLKRGEHLRGCCGVLGKPMALGMATSQAAFRTATEDARLAPISPSELRYSISMSRCSVRWK